MLEILKLACSGFWTFCGVAILLNWAAYFSVNFVLRLFSRTYRFFVMRKHGYPPLHCDSDGDFKTLK